MQAFPEKSVNEVPLQLLLFVDRRTRSSEQVRSIRATLKQKKLDFPFELQVIDVGEKPYLAEHFRLVATPSLIKVHPEPRQILAGGNLLPQLELCWSQWQRSAEDFVPAPEADGLQSARVPPPTDLAASSDVASAASSPSGAAVESSILEPSSPITPTELAQAIAKPGAVQSIARSSDLIHLSDEVFRLKRERESLENQLRFKDQIISMLAHDLRNPLTATSIALETLEMGHSETEGWSSRLTPALTAQLLKHARIQTRAIDRMITEILQASRGATSELRLQAKQLDLGKLCRSILDYCGEQFHAKSLHVKTDIPSDLPIVLADEERIRQVLVNLLDNAIKYTPTGGTIEVSILHRTTQKVQVSIGDNGPGIPEENLERIFEDRFRLERDTAKEGYGLGLSLCRRIIRAHYGQIWADSVLHQGSCFHFTLPVFRV
jgi:two-component system, OmpR family, clock-associated histidine kinase SasA